MAIGGGIKSKPSTSKPTPTIQNQTSKQYGVIETVYMQKIVVTKYPDGREYQQVTMWKVGDAPKARKAKKSKKKEGKKTVIETTEDY